MLPRNLSPEEKKLWNTMTLVIEFMHTHDDAYAWCLLPRCGEELDGVGRRVFGAAWSRQLRREMTPYVMRCAEVLRHTHDRYIETFAFDARCPSCGGTGCLMDRLAKGELFWEIYCTRCGTVVDEEDDGLSGLSDQ